MTRVLVHKYEKPVKVKVTTTQHRFEADIDAIHASGFNGTFVHLSLEASLVASVHRDGLMSIQVEP